MSDRGVTVARAARRLRDEHGYVPDVIFGHSGWGETLFLKQVWPEAADRLCRILLCRAGA
jgi:ribosomal protein L25 (general stress protein Ctc)